MKFIVEIPDSCINDIMEEGYKTPMAVAFCINAILTADFENTVLPLIEEKQ